MTYDQRQHCHNVFASRDFFYSKISNPTSTFENRISMRLFLILLRRKQSAVGGSVEWLVAVTRPGGELAEVEVGVCPRVDAQLQDQQTHCVHHNTSFHLYTTQQCSLHCQKILPFQRSL